MKVINLKNGNEIFNCPCCKSHGKKYVQPYVLSSLSINKSKYLYKFFHYPLFCEECGHIWNKTQPLKYELENYYKDQLPNIIEDYDTEKRINLIISKINKKNLKKQNKIHILDYGSNNKLDFHKIIEEKGLNLSMLDVGSTKSYKNNFFDIITCYFMLEHSLDPELVFKFFNLKIKPNGLLFVEVPDSTKYHKDFSGLMFEHQQHFQPHSLDCLAKRYGFSRVSTSKTNCSRPFGFISIFKKSLSNKNNLQIINTKHLFEIGRNQQIKIDNFFENFSKDICSIIKLQNEVKIYIWGINDNYLLIRKNLDKHFGRQKPALIAIDINPLKKSYTFKDDQFLLSDEANQVLEKNNNPKNCLIITASSHWEKILSNIIFKGKIFVVNPFDKFNPIKKFKNI